MSPQEVGQREASGRKQREVHPQQLHRGSELGAAEPCRSPRKGPLPSPGSQAAMSTLCQCLESRDKSPGILRPVGLIFLLTVKSTVNKGGLVSSYVWGPEWWWGRGWQSKAGQGLQGGPRCPGPVALGSCPLPWASLNQLQRSGMELSRPWHQTLIRRDPAPC